MCEVKGKMVWPERGHGCCWWLTIRRRGEWESGRRERLKLGKEGEMNGKKKVKGRAGWLDGKEREGEMEMGKKCGGCSCQDGVAAAAPLGGKR